MTRRSNLEAKLYDWETRQFLRRQMEDIGLYTELARELGGPILELGAGSGRVTLPLVREGFEVFALDLDADMLEAAAEKLVEERDGPGSTPGKVSFVRSDMTDFSLNREFPLVLIPYNSFLCLHDREQQIACLDAVRSHLAPGGRLLVEVHPFQLHVQASNWEHLATEFLDESGTVVAMYEKVDVDHPRQLTHFHERYELFRPGGEPETFEKTLSLRTVHRFEMELLLESCGYEICDLWGGFDRRPYEGEEAYTMIFSARTAAHEA